MTPVFLVARRRAITSVRRALVIAVAIYLVATATSLPRAYAHAGAEQLYFEDFQITSDPPGYQLTAHLIDFSTGVGALGFGVVATLTPSSGGRPTIASLQEEKKGHYGGHLDVQPGKYGLKLSGRQVAGGIAGTPDDQRWNITLGDRSFSVQAGNSHSELLQTLSPIFIAASVVAVLIRSRRLRHTPSDPAPVVSGSESSDDSWIGAPGDEAGLSSPSLAQRESK